MNKRESDKKMKCILSFRVARFLLSRGFKIVDISTSSKIPGNLVFVFEQSEELNKALAELPKIK